MRDVEKEQESFQLNGKLVCEPEKVRIRSLGGGSEGNTLPKTVLSALLVKFRRHRFLNLIVVIDEHGKRFLVAETSEE